MTFSTTNGWSAASLARPWLNDSAGKSAANRLLADIQELAPYIQSRSDEMEASGQIPTDLIESLRAIGVFRMFVPRSHGGLELDFIDGIEIIQALARIDGSVGWITLLLRNVST